MDVCKTLDSTIFASSLVQGDIDRLRHHVCGIIAKFYKDYDPRVSLDTSFVTSVISSVHLTVNELITLLDIEVKKLDKEKKK